MSWMANSHVGSYLKVLIFERKTAEEAEKGMDELDKLMVVSGHFKGVS
jgi:hypothetical protein